MENQPIDEIVVEGPDAQENAPESESVFEPQVATDVEGEQIQFGPGFAVNRILCPMINEAIFALQEGMATAEDIDTGMKLGCNHPIGPLALADMVGLDTLLAVMQVFYEGFNDPKYRPAPLLKELVAAGRLGRKTRRGFYVYE